MAKKTKFNGRILMIGYGSVGHCTLPLIARHLDMPLSRVAIVEAVSRAELMMFLAFPAAACVTPSRACCSR